MGASNSLSTTTKRRSQTGFPQPAEAASKLSLDVGQFRSEAKPRISILINNYNYASYLSECIQSAIDQSYPAHEVIVVDDGSTDDSIEIAQSFGSAIRIIEKTNGGQASAFNAGFKASRGDWILFLDADDFLNHHTLEQVSAAIEPGLSKIHFALNEGIQNEGTLLIGDRFPPYPLSEGDVLEVIKDHGNYGWPPTSGNVFERSALEKIMPLDEENYRLCADLVLCLKIAKYGHIKALKEPLGVYRLHSQNGFSRFSTEPHLIERKVANLIQHEQLVKDMVSEQASEKIWKERTAIESAMLLLRFAPDSKLVHRLPPKRKLRENYLSRSSTSGLQVLKRDLAWWIFLLSPPAMIKRFMNSLILKAQKNSVS